MGIGKDSGKGRLGANLDGWQADAEQHEREGRLLEAAKLHEQHENWREAGRLYATVGDVGTAAKLLASEDDRPLLIELLLEQPVDKVLSVLVQFQSGLADQFMEAALRRERWPIIAELYQRASQWADAGQAWERAGRIEEAISAYGQAGEKAAAERLIRIQITDRSTTDLLARAILAHANRNNDEAKRLYERGLKEQPSEKLIMSYAAMEKNRNRKGEAMRVYDKGIELYPQSAKLREDAGILAASLGQNERALELLHSALNLRRMTQQGGEKGVLLALARTYFNNGRLREAVKYYEEARHAFGRGRTSLPEKDVLQMNLAKVRTQHHRGNLTVNFITGARLQIERANLLDVITEGADLIVRMSGAEFEESYGIIGRFAVRSIFKESVTHEDIADIDRVIQTATRDNTLDEPMALMVVSSLPLEIQRQLFKRIEERQKFAPIIVPVTQSDIESAATPIDALRGALNQWLYRRDLFAVNSPVVGRRFFGRNRPLAELQEAISRSIPTGVFGLRKVGKTSLLQELERRVAADIVIYFDLLGLPSEVTDCRWLYWQIASKLYQKTKSLNLSRGPWRLGGRFEDFLAIPSDYPVSIAFDSDLRHVLGALRNWPSAPRPKLVLLFDEIERLLPNKLGKPGLTGFFDFMSYLRGIHQESSEFVVILTGANPDISERSQFDGRDNPVFNFFREIYLQFLEKHECDFMITTLGRGMGVRFMPEALAEIYLLTGGHPFFTRQLCSYITERYKDRPLTVNREMILETRHAYLLLATKDLREVLDRLQRDFPEEYEICLVLARSGGRMPIDSLKTQARNDFSIRHLVGYQILRLENGEAVLSMDLLNLWLKDYV